MQDSLGAGQTQVCMFVPSVPSVCFMAGRSFGLLPMYLLIRLGGWFLNHVGPHEKSAQSFMYTRVFVVSLGLNFRAHRSPHMYRTQH